MSLSIVGGLALGLLGPLASPAVGAVPTTQISLTATPPANAASGTSVTMAGSVVNGVVGQPVKLQLRNGGAWTTVASAQLPRRRTFDLSTAVFLGVNELRVVAKPVKGEVSGSKSAVRTTNGLPVAPAEAGPASPFEVTGRLATAGTRPVNLQADNGGWETVASGSSSETGEVSLTTALERSTAYRIVAPAATVGGVALPAVITKQVRVLKGARTPAFTVTSLPPAYRNRIYNYFDGFSTSSGWSYSVVGGALPPGMELTGDGYLDGTPQVAGSFTFRVRITSGTMTPAERTFTLHVAPNGRWLDTDLEIQALDNAGRFATLTCGSSCSVSTPPQVVDLTTGDVQTAPWPADVTQPAAAQVEDISGDGRHVLFFAGRDNWPYAVGQGSALYLWDRIGGTTVKISDGGHALYSGTPGRGLEAAVDGDGSTVVYELTGPDVDDNGTADDTEVHVWERGAGTTNLSADPRIGSDFLTRPEISDDGNLVTFLQGYWGQGDRIRLFDRTTNELAWVSPELDPNGSRMYALAANGASVAYSQDVGQVPGDEAVTLWETVLWDRAGNVTQVVSRTITGAPLRSPHRAGSGTDAPPSVAVSGDGRFVYFDSEGDFFEDDTGGVRSTYFWDRSTNTVTLMPFVPGETGDWPHYYERWAEPSYDGSVVYVQGYRGGLDRPMYRFERDPRP